MKRLFVAAVVFAASLAAYGGEITIQGETSVRLAAPEEAHEILSARDHFTTRLTPLEMKVRMWTDRDVSREEFLAHAGAQALGFSDGEHARLESVFASISANLDALDLRPPFPPVITLVKSAGLEEGGAAYCRGPVVVLPAQLLWAPQPVLERIVTHELFHVLSTANPGLRDPLYVLVGFVPCDDIELPPELAEVSITNPDAFWNTHCIEVTVDGEDLKVIPVNLLDISRYDPRRPGRIWDILDSRLLVVEKRQKWEAVLIDGNPRLLDPRKAGDYLVKLGGNTDYTIHPEEVIAENFQIMVRRERNIPSPEIPAEILAILREHSKQVPQPAGSTAETGAQD